MTTVDSEENRIQDPRLLCVAALWETHHPLQIADWINTRFSLEGKFRWTYYHVENAHQTIARLDREGLWG